MIACDTIIISTAAIAKADNQFVHALVHFFEIPNNQHNSMNQKTMSTANGDIVYRMHFLTLNHFRGQSQCEQTLVSWLTKLHDLA